MRVSPWKQQGLSLIFRTHVEKLGVMAHPGDPETGRRRRRISLAYSEVDSTCGRKAETVFWLPHT